MNKYLQLNDIDCYKRTFSLSNLLWNTVLDWNQFERNTVGIQFVRSVDSISANIAEGFRRFGKRDKIKFYYYSLGSVRESFDWNEKSKKRKLLTESEYRKIFGELQELPKEIHQLIKYTNLKLKQ